MHSRLHLPQHHHTAVNSHLPPPHMLLQPFSSSYTTTTTTTNNPSLLYASDETLTTESSPASASAAANNHKEAEKRRRERINFHLNRLRAILHCNSKADKASLLAKVVQRLKELKQLTSEIEHHENIPSERDEITVISSKDDSNDGRIIIKASMSCEDRSDLLANMIQTLNSLQMSPVRVEMVAIGGRIKNVILVECDCEKDDGAKMVQCVREALGCLVTSNPGSNRSSKRRRMMV